MKEPTKGAAPRPRPVPGPALRAQRAGELEVDCPLCAQPIAVGEAGWSCCRDCLTRHHRGCWQERGGCSACGGEASLGFVPTRHDLRRPGTLTRPARLGSTRTYLVAALAALTAAGLALALGA